jgi:hypothetical protein
MVRTHLAAVAAIALCVAPGCKNDSERPPAQAPGGFQAAQAGPGSYPPAWQTGQQPTPAPGQPGAPPQPGAPAPQPGQVSPLGAILSDPNALQNIIAGALAGTAASMSAVTGGEQSLLEQGIRMQAQIVAKGMKAEGPLISAKLQSGGHADAGVSLRPGACYTVVGFGGPGVFQYQINLITTPPLPPQVLAQSDASGNSPSVGPNEQCIKNPYPLPMQLKVDMHVVKGQGLVGAQLFRK